MTTLTVFEENGKQLSYTDDATEIANILGEAGVFFGRWEATQPVTTEMSNDQIMQCYKNDIDRFVKKGGYQTVDVVSMHPEHEQKKALREKFLSEHTHSEDEIRFFVDGEGLFTLHIGNKVYSTLCCKNDIISVPAGTPHWFDMGDAPKFTAIRFFNNKEGWVAHYTGSDIAKKFPEFSPSVQVQKKFQCSM